MIGDGSLGLSEFLTHEPLPLASIHDAILGFLRNRDDAVVFGAQAVNAYSGDPRMTQDVDVLSTRARDLAETLRSHLAERFHIAVRCRDAEGERGFRVDQVATPRNRNLLDVRQVDVLPPARRLEGLLVAEPAVLVAQKVLAILGRAGRPKALLDRRDVAVLLLRFPELRSPDGPVAVLLRAWGAEARALALWPQLAAETFLPDED